MRRLARGFDDDRSASLGVTRFGGVAAQLAEAILFPLALPAIDLAAVTHGAQDFFDGGRERILA